MHLPTSHPDSSFNDFRPSDSPDLKYIYIVTFGFDYGKKPFPLVELKMENAYGSSYGSSIRKYAKSKIDSMFLHHILFRKSGYAC